MQKNKSKLSRFEKNNISYVEAINSALIKIMKKNKKVICFGLGINDPKNIFGSTKNLLHYFGSKRVFDIPTSENALTGVAVGLSLNSYIPIMMHQRFDFFLLAIDQLVNSAAKWKFMFGHKRKFKMVFRLIIGRGWGQGPTHSQNYISWFRNVPNIKIFCPTFPDDAYKLYLKLPSIEGPIIIVEHRWVHFQKQKIKLLNNKKNIFKCNFLSKGNNLTIVSYSYSTIEIIKLYKILKKNRIAFDHIDLNSIKPLDINSILKSLKKTGRLLILDNMSFPYCSVGKDIISMIAEKNVKLLKKSPLLLTLPDMPTPTSYFQTKNYYISHKKIISKIEMLLGKKIKYKNFSKEINHDKPDSSFTGPF